jgi:hypothetical protein
MEKIIFEKQYDGEEIADAQRDVMESFDERFNELAKDIPQDDLGFQKGIFTITINWNSEGGI